MTNQTMLHTASDAIHSSPPIIDDLSEARRVLAIEAAALNQMSQSLPQDFSDVIQIFATLKGRVIITGMGKSGHIARKIAATLSSTGTPSFYIHPGEASHGDLGMITAHDAILALSNSGETTELADIVAFACRHAIPLVGITSNRYSSLATNAQYCLILPDAEEACPLGLAPTTSTTLMVALGDAIAMAVLKRRNFTTADFRSLHPGGQLGQRLLRVDQLMHTAKSLPLVKQSTLMKYALVDMTTKGFGCLGIVNDDQCLTGIITDGDIRRHVEDNFLQLTVDQVMTRDPMVIMSNTLAVEALNQMNKNNITSLFIVHEESSRIPIGLIHIHDCLRAGIS